jgi:hypothetical protein
MRFLHHSESNINSTLQFFFCPFPLQSFITLPLSTQFSVGFRLILGCPSLIFQVFSFYGPREPIPVLFEGRTHFTFFKDIYFVFKDSLLFLRLRESYLGYYIVVFSKTLTRSLSYQMFYLS